MNKELCFNIENKDLFLEQVLVDYMDIPVFFLCKGENQYYVALCTDIDELNYIVVKSSLFDVYNLLHGKIPMRDIILKQKEYWDVVSGNEISLDIITKKNINSLEKALLPEETACFKILTKKIQLFVEKFDGEFLAATYFLESDIIAELNEQVDDCRMDVLLRNVDQFIELVKFKVDKPVFPRETLYDEEMKFIKTAEVTLRNFGQFKQIEKDDSFDLTGSFVSDIAVAA